MQRKTKKKIFLIFGFVATAVFTGIFLENISKYELWSDKFWGWIAFQMSGVFLVGVIPICISILMHSRDIKLENEKRAKFLKALSITIILVSIFLVAFSPFVCSEISIRMK